MQKHHLVPAPRPQTRHPRPNTPYPALPFPCPPPGKTHAAFFNPAISDKPFIFKLLPTTRFHLNHLENADKSFDFSFLTPFSPPLPPPCGNSPPALITKELRTNKGQNTPQKTAKNLYFSAEKQQFSVKISSFHTLTFSLFNLSSVTP